jgi:sarcosine oxidase subunit alpha
MLASAAQRYAGQFAVAPGRRAVLVTNNDSGYEVARQLRDSGVEVAAIVDHREDGATSALARSEGMRVRTEARVACARGRRDVQHVRIALLGGGRRERGPDEVVACDCVLVSGGWDPAVHLYSQAGGRLAYDEVQRCFVPDPGSKLGILAAGAANGFFAAGDCVADGRAAGAQAAAGAGWKGVGVPARPPRRPFATGSAFADTEGRCRSFVDLQSDVTAADLRLAAREGFVAVEHAKRYTTAGMGIDQGKVGNVAALEILASATGRDPSALGTTTFRPPFVPVTFGTLAGRETGALFDPVRQVPVGDWHARAGAVLEPVGLWRRPTAYPRPGEGVEAAALREARAVRERVGLVDASTLGKIEVVGRDAVTVLDRIYTNAWSNLGIGQCRYGLMLRENGMVFDDGVCARLGERRYVMTTTSGNAPAVERWLDEWLQCEWRDLHAHVIGVTAQWATFALAGPRARDVLERCTTDVDVSPEAFPHLAVRCGRVAGVPVRILRVSYTGELSYEINVAARFGRSLWERLLECGHAFGIEPVGLQAVDSLRIEKGFIAVGHDTDGTVTPLDLGMGWIVSRAKADFVGCRGLACADARRAGRKQLVGLAAIDRSHVLKEGSPIVAPGARLGDPPVPMIGHVTSSAFGAGAGRSVALALLVDGRARIGERVTVVERGQPTAAIVSDPRFYDIEGARMHG